MEILSDTIFKGNVNVEGNLNVGLRGKLSVSEFEFANDLIHFNGGTTKLKDGTMVTTDQIDNINSNIKNITLGNPEIPANCTRFYFHREMGDVLPGCVPNLSNYPIVQVYKRSSVTNNPQLTQMDIEYYFSYCSGTSYYNFIGNIADHSDVIRDTEFILVVKN